MLLGNRLSAADKRRLAMLYSNNAGGNLRQQLLDGAPFLAELTHTAVPQRAATGTTATFTRATTKTWPNNDGYLVTGVSGEIGFVGARRVRNLLSKTEGSFNDGVNWGKDVGGTGVLPVVTDNYNAIAAPDGTFTASRVILDRSAGGTFSRLMQVAIPTSTTQIHSIWMRTTAGGTQTVTLRNGVLLSGGVLTTVTGTWTRFSNVFPVAGGTNTFEILSFSTTGGTQAPDILIWHPQAEDITGRADQTTPSEYVSVGVPGDWAGSDLVTNGTFDTDTTGWTLSNATAAVSSGEVTLTNTAAAYGTLRQAITTVVGTKYILSGTARVGSATIAYVQAGTYAGAGDLLALSTSSSSNTFLTGTFTATGTTTHLSVAPDATSGHTAIFDNISVKPAYYHGSFVDGVKCFATDINGSPIPSSTLLGYQAQGARTNLCLQSNAFTTTWANSPALSTLSQNVIGPDGAVSAWTCADTDAANTSRLYQSITLTAAAYTASLFVKKTSGATSFPVIALVTGTVYGLATLDTNNGVATAWTANGYGTTLSGVSARCSSFNSDFWRFELTATGTAAAYTYQLYPAGTTNATQSTGVIDAAVTGSVVFYGAQLELGSFASSYIPTTTIAVARNADVLTYSSAGNILGTAGWAYAEWTYPRAATTTTSPRIINTGAGSVPLYLASAIDGDLGLYDGAVRDGPTPAYPVTTPTKSASTWGGTAATITNAGVSVTTAFDGDMNVGSTIDIACINGTGGFELNGTIRNVRIGQRALSSSELQAVTK